MSAKKKGWADEDRYLEWDNDVDTDSDEATGAFGPRSKSAGVKKESTLHRIVRLWLFIFWK